MIDSEILRKKNYLIQLKGIKKKKISGLSGKNLGLEELRKWQIGIEIDRKE